MRFNKSGPGLLADGAGLHAVSAFFDELLEQGFNFHPDNSGGEYVHCGEAGGQVPSFSELGASEYDHLMLRAFDVCGRLGGDIYTLGLEAFARYDTPGVDWEVPDAVPGVDWGVPE